jgi:adenine-specific DNA-methyltransferase
VDWGTTHNLMIEGDNLEVLKLLQKSYSGKVKMIYIDPPYNTGNDFVYSDDYRDGVKNYLNITGQVDGNGQKISSNTEASGRFHTNWLNMMYPRLKVARNLLRDDGIILISLDDGEIDNLRKLCSEIFGEENFITTVIWQKKYAPANDAKWFSDNHDYIVLVARRKEVWRPNLLPRTDEANARYMNPDNDSRGVWKSGGLDVKTYSEEYDYEITTPSGRIVRPPAGACWRVRKNAIQRAS